MRPSAGSGQYACSSGNKGIAGPYQLKRGNLQIVYAEEPEIRDSFSFYYHMQLATIICNKPKFLKVHVLHAEGEGAFICIMKHVEDPLSKLQYSTTLFKRVVAFGTDSGT